MKRAVWIGIILLLALLPMHTQAIHKKVRIGQTEISGGGYWVNDGKGGITSTGANEENYNVWYDEEARRLVLRDAQIVHQEQRNSAGIGFYNGSAMVTIVLEGENSISITVDDGTEAYSEAEAVGIFKESGDLHIEGEGSLHIQLRGDSAAYGVYVEGGELFVRNVAMDIVSSDPHSSGSVLRVLRGKRLMLENVTLYGENLQHGLNAHAQLQMEKCTFRTKNVAFPLDVSEYADVYHSTIESEQAARFCMVWESMRIMGSKIVSDGELQGMVVSKQLHVSDSEIRVRADQKDGLQCRGLIVEGDSYLELIGKENGLQVKGEMELRQGVLAAAGENYGILVIERLETEKKPEDRPKEIKLPEGYAEKNGARPYSSEWIYNEQWNVRRWETVKYWETQTWFVNEKGEPQQLVMLAKPEEMPALESVNWNAPSKEKESRSLPGEWMYWPVMLLGGAWTALVLLGGAGVWCGVVRSVWPPAKR